MRARLAKKKQTARRSGTASRATEAPSAVAAAGKREAELLSSAVLLPTMQAALTVQDFNRAFGELHFATLASDLRQQCAQVRTGDLSRVEALLTAQAHTLDAIFNTLARKSMQLESPHLMEVHLRLALKAQSQCRATVEGLAAIRNPQPMAFVRQANISNGPQQVNNGPAWSGSRTEDSENQPNKVLEEQNGERLDG